MQVVPMGPTTAEEYVDKLEEMGGDLVAFARMYSPEEDLTRWLYNAKTVVDKEKEQRVRWKQAIDRHAEISLDFLKAKTLEQMETWQGGDDKGLSGKVAFAKLVLSDILGSRLEGAKRRAAHPYLRDLRPAPGETRDDEEETDSDLDELEESMSA